jgi:hypothetical protein
MKKILTIMFVAVLMLLAVRIAASWFVIWKCAQEACL